ncbi:MAG: diguanylate cyclase [Clostridiales bacterium]|nr:diguanylate cyclase [Clostridiales bacterium]
MSDHKSVFKQFKTILIVMMILAIASTSLIMTYELSKITTDLSKQYSSLYSSELIGHIESKLNRETALALKASTTEVILDWMSEESNSSAKYNAYNELMNFNNSFGSGNSFVAISGSGNMYYLNSETTLFNFKPSESIEVTSEDKNWYSEALESDKPYLLSINYNQYTDQTFVWINVKVVDKGEILGIIGTGVNLDDLIEEIILDHHEVGISSIIIDDKGIIQIDSDVINKINKNDRTLRKYVAFESFHEQVQDYLDNPSEVTVIKLKSSPYAYAVLAPIMSTNWHVVSFMESGVFFNPNRFLFVTFFILLIIMTVGAIISYSVRKLFVKPFTLLVSSLDQNDSNYETKIYGLDRNDEFGTIANSINHLTDRLVRSVPVGLFLLDKNGDFLFGNKYFLDQFGLDSNDAFIDRYGSTLEELFTSSNDYEVFIKTIHENLTLYVFETELRKADYRHFWAELHLTKVSKDNGYEYEGILLNIQLKKEYESELINLATTDPLTSLYNRRHFDEMAKIEVERSNRHGNDLSLVIFDLDHFKMINDQYGHIVGDEILSEVTTMAGKCIRASDILARWGGEEFSILLPETDLHGAYQVAEKIRLMLNDYTHPIVKTTTASFGVSQRHINESYYDWFERTDRALYYAKEHGRNQVGGYNPNEPVIDPLIQLTWHHNFSSGNVIIDEQHKELFNLANSLISSGMKLQSDEAQNHAILAFVGFIRKHFEDEELILKDTDYPVVDQISHAEMHKNLLDRIEKLFNKENISPEDVMSIAMILIQEVVYEHMIKEDSKYFEYTKTSGIKK